MAEQNHQDVVTKAQSVGDPSPTDVSATQYFDPTARAASEQSISIKDSFITSEPTPSVTADQQPPTIVGEKGALTALQETEVRHRLRQMASTKLTGCRSM